MAMRRFQWANGRTVVVPTGGIENVSVSGTTFDGRQEFIKHIRIGDQVEIMPCTCNAYDDKAVEVHHDGHHIGHLPAKTGLSTYVYDGIVTGDLNIMRGIVTATLGGYDGKNYGVRIYLFDEDGAVIRIP